MLIFLIGAYGVGITQVNWAVSFRTTAPSPQGCGCAQWPPFGVTAGSSEATMGSSLHWGIIGLFSGWRMGPVPVGDPAASIESGEWVQTPLEQLRSLQWGADGFSANCSNSGLSRGREIGPVPLGWV